MRFKKLNSKVEVNVKVTDYLVDWDRKVSAPQKKVKDFLRPYWKTHVVLEEFRIPGGLRRIDLMSLTRRIAVEVSPETSHSYNEWFHKNRANFAESVKRDLEKAEWAEQNDFTYVSLNEEDIEILSPEFFKEEFGITL